MLLAEEIVARVPAVQQVRLVSSGTEATMSAIRLARGFTERSNAQASGVDVADSIRAELTGLIGSGGLPPSLGSAGHTDRVLRGPIRVGPGRSASMLGRQIAAAVLAGPSR